MGNTNNPLIIKYNIGVSLVFPVNKKAKSVVKSQKNAIPISRNKVHRLWVMSVLWHFTPAPNNPNKSNIMVPVSRGLLRNSCIIPFQLYD